MVGVGPGGRTSVLARATVVNYEGDVLLDEYVCPEKPVTDYRTPITGIRRGQLANGVF